MFDRSDWTSFTEFVAYYQRFGDVHYYLAVRPDGSLWGTHSVPSGRIPPAAKFVQMAGAKDWVSVAGSYWSVAALKKDGTLWRWDLKTDYDLKALPALDKLRPFQLGSRRDWVATAEWIGGTMGLAADGNLWFWWPPQGFYAAASDLSLAHSRKPVLIRNIFSDSGTAGTVSLAQAVP